MTVEIELTEETRAMLDLAAEHSPTETNRQKIAKSLMLRGCLTEMSRLRSAGVPEAQERLDEWRDARVARIHEQMT